MCLYEAFRSGAWRRLRDPTFMSGDQMWSIGSADGASARVPGGPVDLGARVQSLANLLRESNGGERLLQERGSLLYAFHEDDILSVPGHEHDIHAGAQPEGAFREC